LIYGGENLKQNNGLVGSGLNSHNHNILGVWSLWNSLQRVTSL
jgi:hypothetical protein